ncbi:MAG: HlyD family efflux transporter periplasmic adaptor subunit [Alphaproteobacteria bacterium]
MKIAHIFRLLSLPLLLSGCGRTDDQTWQGYVEGEYVLVAAPEGGWLTKVAVVNGQTVNQGDPLFDLEASREQAGQDAAAARVAEAAARLENLTKGKRAEELTVIDEQIRAADANLRFATAELDRQQKLSKSDASARRRFEEARSVRAMAAAKLGELKAQRNVALLPARDDEIAAAQAAAAASRAQLAEAAWRLDQRRIIARAGGVIEDTLRRTGEFVPAGGAVISLLPPENLKLRFFAPEAQLAQLQVGKSVAFRCDSCPANLTAVVSFISSEAEFTPPVIYSKTNRNKLVFLVEAKPSVYGAYLRPGLPVDVQAAP